MDVAGGDAGHPEPLGEPGEPAVAGAVAPLVGPLQLDPEALAAEGAEQPPAERRRRAAARRAPRRPARTPSRAQPERQMSPSACCFSSLERHPRLARPALGVVAGVGVGGGEQPAEVAVAGARLDQQGEVGELGRFAVSRRRSARRR